jgi:hypothetical protein
MKCFVRRAWSPAIVSVLVMVVSTVDVVAHPVEAGAPPEVTGDDTASIADLEEFAEVAPDPTSDVAIDRWTEVSGQSLRDVAPGAEPTETTERFGAFEAPINAGDDYAIRMRTLLTPEVSGTYRFWISGDDDMRLFMNTDGDDPAGARRIAYIAGWTTLHQWDRFWSQRSVWIELEAGTPYYLEAIGKEGSGDDHFSVAWERQGEFDRRLVPASVIESTPLGAGGWRSATPAGLPEAPAAMMNPEWTSSATTESLTVGWADVDGAEWYEVRLEGSGEARDLIVDQPTVQFDDLVPDTRYVVEVAPGSAGGRQEVTGRVFMTRSGPYPTPVSPAPGNEPTVAYDHWDTGWWTLTSVPEGLAPVSTTTLSTGLETPPMQGDNHASRIRAVITPNRTDVYTFHLSGDDDARLLFNPDGDWAHGATPVAYVSGWTEQYQWDRYASQTTAGFELEADHEYYIEAIGVHGLGLDHLEVGWSTPGSAIEVVPADVLSPTMTGAGGWRVAPTPLLAVPGSVKHLDAATTSSSATLTWDPPKVSDKDGAAEFYEVIITSDAVSDATWVYTTSATFEGLSAYTEYEVEVVAWNASGRGKAESEKFKTDKAPVPDDVKDLKVSVSSSSAVVVWEAPKVSDDHAAADRYVVVLVDGDDREVERVEVTATSATFEGLSAYTEYEVHVVAWNSFGAGKAESEKFKTDKTDKAETTTTTTTPLTGGKLRITFMCRAFDGGDIANDDYLDRHEAYPVGSYVWRVRSENEIGPVAYEVRVGNGAPFDVGVLGANETRFFATDVAHKGATVHWYDGSKGTASANESACSASTTTTTTTTTTVSDDGACHEGEGHVTSNGNGHDDHDHCEEEVVDSGDPIVYLSPEHIDAFNEVGKSVREALGAA